MQYRLLNPRPLPRGTTILRIPRPKGDERQCMEGELVADTELSPSEIEDLVRRGFLEPVAPSMAPKPAPKPRPRR